MIKSPLRYPGGKSRAIKIISDLIPTFKEFREPFVGGGSVFLYAKQKYPQKIFWVNDLYTELFLFWKESQNSIDALISKVSLWKESFTEGKALYKYLIDNIQNFSDTDKAAAFFTFNRITFSGTTLSGGYSEGAYNGRFTPSSIARLRSFNKVIQGTKITNSDYSELLKAKGKDVFIFLDPPYYSATKSSLYGKNGNLHRSFDHLRFASLIKECKHKWLITYDDCDYIRDLFSFAHIAPWNLTYGMRNVANASDQLGKELFISNFYIPDFQELKETRLSFF
jgi:DNA adenine methylase